MAARYGRRAYRPCERLWELVGLWGLAAPIHLAPFSQKCCSIRRLHWRPLLFVRPFPAPYPTVITTTKSGTARLARRGFLTSHRFSLVCPSRSGIWQKRPCGLPSQAFTYSARYNSDGHYRVHQDARSQRCRGHMFGTSIHQQQLSCTSPTTASKSLVTPNTRQVPNLLQFGLVIRTSILRWFPLYYPAPNGFGGSLTNTQIWNPQRGNYSLSMHSPSSSGSPNDYYIVGNSLSQWKERQIWN